MAIDIESKALQALLDQFKLNTRLFNNVIEEIIDEKSNFKISGNTNSLKWISGHILNSRFGIGNLIGMQDRDPNEDIFGHGKAIDLEVEYPKITVIKSQWNEFAPKFIRKLENMTEAELDKDAPFNLPIDDNSTLGAISFFAHHEAYHLGQLGLLRKYLEFGPMKYS